MAASYWQPDWFDQPYFPAVWFAPADETGVPTEELRPEFHVGGGAQTRRQFHDATDDDLRRMVHDKWEAQEQKRAPAQPDAKQTKAVVRRLPDPTDEPRGYAQHQDAHAVSAAIAMPPILAMHWPDMPMTVESEPQPMVIDEFSARRAARMKADDEALLVIFAQM